MRQVALTMFLMLRFFEVGLAGPAGRIARFQRRSHARTYTEFECGSVISSNGGVFVNPNSICSMKIRVPDKHAVILKTRNIETSSCEPVQITDDVTGVTTTMCPHSFIGGSSQYTIDLSNLPATTAIDLLFSKTSFGCGDTVPNIVVGLPLDFVKESTSEDCALILPSGTKLTVAPRITPEKDHECPIQFEILQGYRLGRLTTTSENQCSDSDPFELDLICGAAVLWMGGAAGSRLRIQLQPIVGDTLVQRVLQCVP